MWIHLEVFQFSGRTYVHPVIVTILSEKSLKGSLFKFVMDYSRELKGELTGFWWLQVNRTTAILKNNFVMTRVLTSIYSNILLGFYI